MVENEAVNITAYVRQYKDPTGVLWHTFHKYWIFWFPLPPRLTLI